eukprot:121400_1
MDYTYYDSRNAGIWLMGIMLFILVGTHLIDKPSINDDPKFCYIIKNGIKPLLKNRRRSRLINDDALDLLNKIFVPECNRINMKQLLCHPFLNPNRYIIEMTNTNATIDSEMYDNDIEYTPTPLLAPSTTDNTIDYQLNDEIFMIADEDKSNNNIYPLYGFDNAFRLITTAIITPIGTSIIISMIRSFSKSTTIVYHKCINYNNGNTSVYYTHLLQQLVIYGKAVTTIISHQAISPTQGIVLLLSQQNNTFTDSLPINMLPISFVVIYFVFV